jgi:hypothetical protein
MDFDAALGGLKERVVVSHISRKTSEMWGTRHLFVGQGLEWISMRP